MGSRSSGSTAPSRRRAWGRGGKARRNEHSPESGVEDREIVVEVLIGVARTGRPPRSGGAPKVRPRLARSDVVRDRVAAEEVDGNAIVIPDH